MQKAQEIYHARKDYFLSTLKRLGPLVGQKVSTPDGEGILISVTPKDTEGFPFVSPSVTCQVWFEENQPRDPLSTKAVGSGDTEGYHADDVKAIEKPISSGAQVASGVYQIPSMTKDNNSEFVSAVADYLRREGIGSIWIDNAAQALVDEPRKPEQDATIKEQAATIERLRKALISDLDHLKNQYEDVKGRREKLLRETKPNPAVSKLIQDAEMQRMQEALRSPHRF